jgi:hypothetical protein
MASRLPVKRYHHLWLPKRGHTAEEYEDAAAGDPERGRFAVADGASESSFAGIWARLLVEEFVHKQGNCPAPLAEWVPAVQGRWVQEVGEREFSWYAESKFQQGAFATFLGLALTESGTEEGGAGWRALAVGDACLFQVRGDALLCRFPLRGAGDFNNTPWLIGSRGRPPAGVDEGELAEEGECLPGDTLWLATDALAQWFLARVEAGERPWQELAAVVESPEPEVYFAGWVEGRRDANALRNDDVTVLAVEF